MQSNKECNGRRCLSLWQRVPGIMAAFLFFFCLFPSPLSAVSVHEKEYFDIIKGVDLFGEVYREVSTGYVDPLDVSELMYAGIDGMLRTLDPYTVFLDEEDSGELDEMTSGQYVGVGITIATLDGGYFVTSVVDGYAAAKAGVKAGDSILAINNKEVKNKSLTEVKSLIKGAAGTSLTIQLKRQGASPFTASLVREEIRVNSVSYATLFQGIGYIEMKNFSARSANELRSAILGLQQEAKEQRTPMKGIILDLRNNPGGLLNAAVDVTSLFVRKGSEVVSIRGRSVEMAKSYLTETPPLDVVLPLVVLVNKESASASEIVAGAIQDLDRGVIIGERSFGKGLVQSVIRISYDNTLKLTTAKYYTPSGRLIQKENKAAHESRKVLPKAPGNNASQVFYTKNKRIVYGSGGITPDIELSEQVTSPYLSELRKKGMLFLFASLYSSSSPVMPPQPLDRQQLLALFGNFLRDKKFVYTSDSERRFNELKESMKKVQPQQIDNDLNSLSSLQQEIDRLKEQEIEKESTGVAKALEVEILRHYKEPLARRVELDDDPDVTKAIEILSDSRKYSSILHP